MEELTRIPRSILNPIFIAIGVESELCVKGVSSYGSTQVSSIS
jgi:hypothetical protein